jgi:hypothetical protein
MGNHIKRIYIIPTAPDQNQEKNLPQMGESGFFTPPGNGTGFVATLQVMGISLCFPTNPEVVGRQHA